MAWDSYYLEQNCKYYLYTKTEYGIERGIYDLYGMLINHDTSNDGIFKAWPVSLISVLASNENKTEICIDGEKLMVKANYLACKDVLLKNLTLHNRTMPLHYIYKDSHKGEHSRMLFIVDKGKYNKQDIMDIYRRASRA